MAKQTKPGKPKPLYRRKAPKPGRAVLPRRPNPEADQQVRPTTHYHPIAPAHFELREDGTIELTAETQRRGDDASSGRAVLPHRQDTKAAQQRSPTSDDAASQRLRASVVSPSAPPKLIFHDDARKLWLYHGNSLELLDAIAAKYPEGRFDCIFADPPYFLSNGGITCHAGRMVKVDKGDWDTLASLGSGERNSAEQEAEGRASGRERVHTAAYELMHEFNLEWLRRCQRVLKPNGTLWVSGTQHVIFSIGYAMQQLGYKILNDIAWEKPNPPPNLSCRYFTHSTETILWAAKNERSKHTFNYQLMRQANGGKQMKTVWTMTAPGSAEKEHGKHPTQKPVALIERCLLAATNEGDLVLDPFLGGGTTAVACVRLKRACVGIELGVEHARLAERRANREVIILWLREFRMNLTVAIFFANDLDPDSRSMDRINGVKDGEPKAECIYHETKFVFLSCASVSAASVVHTTVDVSLQEAWAKTPTGKLRETTHVVRCVTEILKVKSS